MRGDEDRKGGLEGSVRGDDTSEGTRSDRRDELIRRKRVETMEGQSNRDDAHVELMLVRLTRARRVIRRAEVAAQTSPKSVRPTSCGKGFDAQIVKSSASSSSPSFFSSNRQLQTARTLPSRLGRS
jgi:hypothetical protein